MGWLLREMEQTLAPLVGLVVECHVSEADLAGLTSSSFRSGRFRAYKVHSGLQLNFFPEWAICEKFRGVFIGLHVTLSCWGGGGRGSPSNCKTVYMIC